MKPNFRAALAAVLLVMASTANALEITTEDRQVALYLARDTQDVLTAVQAAMKRQDTDYLVEIKRPLQAALRRWQNERRISDLVKDTHLGCESALSNLMNVARDKYEATPDWPKVKAQSMRYLDEDLDACAASIRDPAAHYVRTGT